MRPRPRPRGRSFAIVGSRTDAEGATHYGVHLSASYHALAEAPPPGFRAAAGRPWLAEIDPRLRASADPLAQALVEGVRRFETRRFEVPTRRGPLVLDADEPRIVGILNRTPDSFSDGGSLDRTDALLRRAEVLLAEGASWLDLGGESTRPGAAPVSEDEELARVLPAIEVLRARFDCWISIDTVKAAVARLALRAGADLVNDISGGTLDPALLPACALAPAPVVLTHLRGTPRTMQAAPSYDDVLEEVADELAERRDAAETAGLERAALLLDPGIGFGKRFEDNLELLVGLVELRTLGRPLFVGASRKAFLGAILGGRAPGERDAATSATTAWAVRAGAVAIRVHDAGRAADVARVARELAARERPAPWFGSEELPQGSSEEAPPGAKG